MKTPSGYPAANGYPHSLHSRRTGSSEEFFKTFLHSHPAGNGYLALFIAGEGEGGEEEEWHSTSVLPLLIKENHRRLVLCMVNVQCWLSLTGFIEVITCVDALDGGVGTDAQCLDMTVCSVKINAENILQVQ